MILKKNGRKSGRSSVVKKSLYAASPIALPRPLFKRGKTIEDALKTRRTVRAFKDKKLSLQTLSNLLWAARGINRKKGPFGIKGITAASASNSQEIDVYVALEEGTFFYDASAHCLLPIIQEDLRSLAIGHGQGGVGANAPVRLIYVVDVKKFNDAGFQEPGLYDPEVRKSYYYVDTGLIAGNVYLFAASQGFAAWLHNCDRKALTDKLNLRPHQVALFGQTIGYS
jgi:nitroreductase